MLCSINATYQRRVDCVEKSSYWIHSAACWSTAHTAGARIRTSANHSEHKVSQREIHLGGTD